MDRLPEPPTGFAEFVAARSQSLLRAAWLLTGDAGRAEDLLQVAFARAWRHWSRIADGNPEGYVRQVLFRSYLNWWRRGWRAEVPTSLPPERPSDDDVAGDLASRDGIHRALRGLTRRRRAVVIARYVEDRSVAETADLLGCSQGTVKALAFRALATLRADPSIRALLTTGQEPDTEGVEHHGAQRESTSERGTSEAEAKLGKQRESTSERGTSEAEAKLGKH